MIYFSLAHYFNQPTVNRTFANLSYSNPEYFIYKNVCISSVDTFFPFFYWGKNNCNNISSSHIPPREEISALLNYTTTMSIDCGNTLLELTDYLDVKSNAFLEELENGSNIVIVSTPQTLAFIQNQYPSYHIVGSELFSDHDPEGKYWPQLDSIRCFANGHASPYFDQIPKSKIELCVSSTCFNCENIRECATQDCQARMVFSEKSKFLECPNRILKHLTPNEIWDYIKQGYNHFYYDFSGVMPDDTETIIQTYLETLIKDEYRDIVYTIVKKEIENVRQTN